MDDTKSQFLENCIAGFNDAKREDPEWKELTKAEKMKVAEQALRDFERIFFSFECVIQAGIDSRLG